MRARDWLLSALQGSGGTSVAEPDPSRVGREG